MGEQEVERPDSEAGFPAARIGNRRYTVLPERSRELY